MAKKKTFYVKLVKSEGVNSQSIHVIDAKDAFEAIKLVRGWLGVGHNYDTIEAYPWHGEIYYPEDMRRQALQIRGERMSESE